MSFVRAFGLVAVCSITTSAFAEESATTVAELRHLLARADAAVRVDDTPDRYTGSYRSADGMVFYVVQEDGSLTIDLPASSDAAPSRLRADAAGNYFVAAVTTVVKFDTDADGRVTGLVAYPANGGAAIAAAKDPLRRGIVTIEDLPAMRVRRGIVTIEDVATDGNNVAVAAN